MYFEKERISNNQLMFSIGTFIQGSSLLTAFVTAITGNDTWFTTITGYIFALGIVLIYIAMYNRFPGKNLIQINQAVFGKYVGGAISLLYIFFFLSIASLNSRDLGNFIWSHLMPETPYAAIIVLFVITCAYSVRKGIRTIARYGAIFSIFTIVMLFINSGLLLKDMDFQNFLPFLSKPFIDYVQGTHIVSIIPLGEILVFMMIVPSDGEKGAITKPFIGGLSIGAASLLFVSVREIAVLGNAVEYFSLPSFEVMRLVNVANILTRIEDFFAILLMVLRFFKVSILYYAVVLGIAQVFSLRSLKPLVAVVGGVILCFSLVAFDSGMENAFWGSNFAPFYSMIFEVILPLITLAVASISSLIGKKEAVAQ